MKRNISLTLITACAVMSQSVQSADFFKAAWSVISPTPAPVPVPAPSYLAMAQNSVIAGAKATSKALVTGSGYVVNGVIAGKDMAKPVFNAGTQLMNSAAKAGIKILKDNPKVAMAGGVVAGGATAFVVNKYRTSATKTDELTAAVTETSETTPSIANVAAPVSQEQVDTSVVILAVDVTLTIDPVAPTQSGETPMFPNGQPRTNVVVEILTQPAIAAVQALTTTSDVTTTVTTEEVAPVVQDVKPGRFAQLRNAAYNLVNWTEWGNSSVNVSAVEQPAVSTVPHVYLPSEHEENPSIADSQDVTPTVEASVSTAVEQSAAPVITEPAAALTQQVQTTIENNNAYLAQAPVNTVIQPLTEQQLKDKVTADVAAAIAKARAARLARQAAALASAQ